MKISSLLIVLIFALTALAGPKSDTVKDTSNKTQFGAKITPSKINSLDEVVNNYNKYQGKEVTFAATAKKVCKKSGCWMVLKDGKNEVRTLFKDYGFFVPADIVGKKVRVQGIMEQKKVSAATIRHYMKDEGKKIEDIKKVKTGRVQYQFVATGVEII